MWVYLNWFLSIPSWFQNLPLYTLYTWDTIAVVILSKELLYLFKGIKTTFKILHSLVSETARLLSVCGHYYFISRSCLDHECTLTAVGSVQSEVYTQYYKLTHFFTYDTVLKPPLMIIKCFSDWSFPRRWYGGFFGFSLILDNKNHCCFYSLFHF